MTRASRILSGLGALVGVGLGIVALPALTDMPALAAPAAGSPTLTSTGEGPFGTIRGRLVWGGAELPKPEIKWPKGDPGAKDSAVCAKQDIVSKTLIVDPQTKGVAYAIVYLVAPKGQNPEAVKALLARQPKVIVEQKDCQFLPNVVAAHEDQPLVFTSDDPVGHNVHLTGFTNNLNQMVSPGQKLEPKLVAEKRAIKLNCDLHPWMRGAVMIFNHPFFAVTKPDGSFEISGVPAGAQNLILYHDRVGYVNAGAGRGMPVEVKAGETADLGEIKLDPSKVKPES